MLSHHGTGGARRLQLCCPLLHEYRWVVFLHSPRPSTAVEPLAHSICSRSLWNQQRGFSNGNGSPVRIQSIRICNNYRIEPAESDEAMESVLPSGWPYWYVNGDVPEIMETVAEPFVRRNNTWLLSECDGWTAIIVRRKYWEPFDNCVRPSLVQNKILQGNIGNKVILHGRPEIAIKASPTRREALTDPFEDPFFLQCGSRRNLQAAGCEILTCDCEAHPCASVMSTANVPDLILPPER